MTKATGEPLFTEDELALIGTPRKTIREKKKLAARKKLLDRASEWRAAEVERRVSEYDREVATIARQKKDAARLQDLVRLSGREPYVLVNRILSLCRTFDLLPPIAELVDFDGEEVRELAPDTALVLTEHPMLADLCRGGASPSGRLLLALVFILGSKIAMFLKVRDLIEKGPDARAADEAATQMQLELVRSVRKETREMMRRAQLTLEAEPLSVT